MRMLEAARLAPSACNKQPWRFAVVREASLRRRIVEDGFLPGIKIDWALEAPVHVAVGMETSFLTHRLGAAISGVNYPWVDIGIAGEHLVLAATELGLGTCWIGWIKPRAVAQIVGWPTSVKPVAVITVGSPLDLDKATLPAARRKALDQIGEMAVRGRASGRRQSARATKALEKRTYAGRAILPANFFNGLLRLVQPRRPGLYAATTKGCEAFAKYFELARRCTYCDTAVLCSFRRIALFARHARLAESATVDTFPSEDVAAAPGNDVVGVFVTPALVAGLGGLADGADRASADAGAARSPGEFQTPREGVVAVRAGRRRDIGAR